LRRLFHIFIALVIITSIFISHEALAVDDPHPGWEVNIISIPGLPDDVAITAMALDSVGDTHVLISKTSSPFGSYYSKLSGGVWGVPEVVDNTAYHGWNSEIVLDSNDNPRVIYYMDGGSHYGLNYAERIGGVWGRTGLDSRFWTGKSNDLKLDSQGNPHVVYTAIDGNLVYGKRIGGIWSFVNVENMGFTDTGNHVGLALDEMDNPGIVYTSRNTGYLRYARNTGLVWTFSNIEYIRNDSHGIMWVPSYPSIVFDLSGTPHVSYISANTGVIPNGVGLKYARWDGVNWILQTLDEQTYESGLCNSAIRIDSLNTLHVAWWGYPIIVHATLSSPFEVWNSEFVSTIPTWSDVNLQLDYQNIPHITYMPSMGGRYATKVVADLSITKTDSPDPVIAGTDLTYNIIVTNNGPSDATGVAVTDAIPVGTIYVSDTPSQGTYGSGVWDVGNLASGVSADMTLVVKVNSGTTGTILNTTSVTGNETDSDQTNNMVTANTTIYTRTDLSITKTDSPDPVIAGTDLTYTITVTNNGPSDATGVAVTDAIPVGTIYVSDTPSQGAYGSGVWNVGSLASGVSANMTLVVKVNSSTMGTVSNFVSMSGNETDFDQTKNSFTAYTTVNTNTDLSITKTGDARAVVGTNFHYAIKVTNNGPSDATDVEVTDILPAGVTYYESTPSQGTYNNGTGIWTVGSLTSGESASLNIEVTASALPNTLITNTAQVTGYEVDPVSNNSASQNTRVMTAVGGEVFGVSKLGIMAPWLALSLVLVVGGVFLISKRRNES
jgi:uncharacterized repeat protein (TIGR01451 family)